MGAGGEDPLCTALLERARTFAEGARRIDDIVDDDSGLALDITNEVHDFSTARLRTAFLDDGDRRLQMIREDARARDTTEIRRDDNDILELLGTEIVGNGRRSSQMIHRDIKEALNLACVQVDGHDTRHASRRHEVGNQLGGNRLTAARFAILARVCIVWHNRRDAMRRGALAGIRHDEKLHEIVVDWIRRRLDDKNILAANALADHDLGFAIVEMTDISIAEIDADAIRNLVGELRVRIAGQDDQISSV